MKHEKAKAILCKLPIIDMSKNAFSNGGSKIRGGLKEFVHDRDPANRNDYSSMHSRNSARSRRFLIGNESG